MYEFDFVEFIMDHTQWQITQKFKKKNAKSALCKIYEWSISIYTSIKSTKIKFISYNSNSVIFMYLRWEQKLDSSF